LNSELAGIIEAESLGYCVHPGDAKGMAETMLKMYQTERSQLTDMGKRCREYVAYELDRKKITYEYFQQIKTLTSE
jgi:glycosyltransferase involved in cell wall biosynthesis